MAQYGWDCVNEINLLLPIIIGYRRKVLAVELHNLRIVSIVSGPGESYEKSDMYRHIEGVHPTYCCYPDRRSDYGIRRMRSNNPSSVD
jgi:hypothetical protein